MTKRTLLDEDEIYAYFHNHYYSYGYCPTLKEVGDYFGVSGRSAIWKHAKNLVKKGHLRHEKHKFRSWIPTTFLKREG